MTPKSTLDDVTVTVEGVPIRVYLECWPATRGARDSLDGVAGAGPPLEPDELADFEIVAAYVGRHDISALLSDEAWLKISNAVLEVRG